MLKHLIITLMAIAHISFQLNNASAQEAISPLLFGQNAWMPDSIGSQKFGGQLHENWHHIEESSARTVRFGGIGADQNRPSNYQYIRMIDSIRNRGMEPILQVPFYNGKHSAQQAAEIVRYVNVTMQRNIKYWVVGNEPDHVYHYTRSSQVAPYLRSYSFAMKDVDPSIKIIGPETAWFNRGILEGLCNPGGPDDVTGKDSKGRYIIDIVSFHSYAFGGNQTRQQVVENLMAPGEFEDELKELKSWVDNANTKNNRKGSEALKMAITEANIGYKNALNDNLDGNGTTSFIGGQFWAEFLGIAMKHGVEIFNFWSVVEGNNQSLNIGYIDRISNRRQPSWHHFKMMSENFSGYYAPTKINLPNAKAIASTDENKVALMLLNQSMVTSRDFTVKLNNTAISGDDPMKVNVDAGIDREYQGHIPGQSTVLLVFDGQGNLVKKCEYSLENARLDQGPSCTGFELPEAGIKADTNTICTGAELKMEVNFVEGYDYQWRKDGQNIEGATELYYKAKKGGKYTVTLTNEETVFFTKTFELTETDPPSTKIEAEGSTNICSNLAVKLTATEDPEYEYTWNINGVEIPGSDTAVFEATVPGEYAVEVSNDCGRHSAGPIEVQGCDGQNQDSPEEKKEGEDIYCFPNPSNGTFTVEMQTENPGEDGQVVLEILDMVGQVILTMQPNHLDGYIKQAIAMDEGLATGVYTIRIKIGENSYSSRVIINNQS